MKNWLVALSIESGQRDHGDRAAEVFQSVGRLVADRRARRLCDHVRVVPAGQDRLVLEHLVNDRLIVEGAADVGEEVVHGVDGILAVELDGDLAFRGVDFDHRVLQIRALLGSRRSLCPSVGLVAFLRCAGGCRRRLVCRCRSRPRPQTAANSNMLQ